MAARYAERFRHAVKGLIEMPRSGAWRAALGPHARRVVVPPYILIYDYTPGDDTVTPLCVLRGQTQDHRRDTSEGLRSRLWGVTAGSQTGHSLANVMRGHLTAIIGGKTVLSFR